MADQDLQSEILLIVGELRADIRTIKADVAELKAAPAKKRAANWQVFGGFLGLAGLVVAALKLFAGR